MPSPKIPKKHFRKSETVILAKIMDEIKKKTHNQNNTSKSTKTIT